MNFIKQNMHVLCNMKSYECHLMKIKLITNLELSLFLLFVNAIFRWKMGVLIVCWWRPNIIVCSAFAEKPI